MPAEDERGYVYRAEPAMNQDALADLLKDRFRGACAIIRKVDDAKMVEFPSAEAEILPGDWSEGQIFNERAELRWRRTGDGYAVLFLTEKPDSLQTEADQSEHEPPAGLVPVNNKPFKIARASEDENHGFMLWGKPRKEGESGAAWREVRIPRLLCYPLKTEGGPPRLVYRRYCDGETVRWTRLVKLVEVQTNE
jgi:hypothetical protein